MTPRFHASFSAAAFPPGSVARTGTLGFTVNDLAHALFATGRAPGDQARFGDASFWEFVHRASLIPAYVRINSSGRLVKSALALELDRSEKVALSYALGQAVTGIFCEKELGVSHLLHVDRYERRYRVSFGPTRRRPDLFGWSSPGWVVAEAKGRSNVMERALRQKLETQKRAIRTVEGHRPHLSLGCVASFPVKGGAMKVNAFDPENDAPESIDLGIQAQRFFLAYYEPFVTAIERSRRREQDRRMTIAFVDGTDVRIGLDNRILRAVRVATEGDRDGFVGEILDLAGSAQGFDEEAELGQVFPDGTLIGTSWDEAIQVRDWERG